MIPHKSILKTLKMYFILKIYIYVKMNAHNMKSCMKRTHIQLSVTSGGKKGLRLRREYPDNSME